MVFIKRNCTWCRGGQLTDAIAALIEQEQVEANYMTGRSHDFGSKLGYMKAFLEYGVRHNTEGEVFSEWLQENLEARALSKNK